MPDIDWNSLKTAYAAGVGLRELARSVGISENTVLSRAAKEDWSGQIEQAKALVSGRGIVKVDEQSRAIKGGNAIIETLQRYGDRTKVRLAKGISKGASVVAKLPGESVLACADKVKSLVDSASKLHGWGQDSEKSGALVNVNVLGVLPDRFT